jgi:methionyl-tRNA formyltransferase
MSALRVVFMGTARLSCASLQALIDSPDFQIVMVVTQPDRPKGRDLKVQPSPVKELALRARLPVLQPESARNVDFVQRLRGLAPDAIVVAAYGQILPEVLLVQPRVGCVNVHTSLLPKYRGAAPIQWAILNDERETGVTIMKMDAGLDTGDILTQQSTAILPEDSSETLHDRLAQMGARLLLHTLPDYASGRIQSRPQVAELATYAPKIKKEQGHLDWTLPARVLWNRTRGLTPWPGTFTVMPAQAQRVLLKVWKAEVVDISGPPGEILHISKAGIVVGCGEAALRLLLVQREGGRRLTAEQFLAGHSLPLGQKLG